MKSGVPPQPDNHNPLDQMKPILFPLFAALGILGVSCTPTQKSTATGAAAGAALGAIIADGDDHAEGALIGAGVGAAAGAIAGNRKQRRTNPYYY